MRILIIVPHMSTGGLPQVALKRVETLMKNNDVYVVEYRQIAWSYVVQRNKMIEMLGDKFISLGWIDKEELRDKFINVVKKINPDIIHMEEMVEIFPFSMREEHINWLYREDRPYKLVETTHTSKIINKKYFPDKFIFVSPYTKKQYSKYNIPSSVVEYPIEKLEKNKGVAIKRLNFDPEYFHILNVGLFTREKNQSYLFEIAKKLEDYKVHFHFVGNQAENFTDYWKPLLEKKLDNCFIHGERSDVDLFYQASDLVVHPSILELNPLTIKEATSYDLPVYLNKLDTYDDMYNTYKNIKYLKMDIDKDSINILDSFNIKRKDDNTTFEKSLMIEYNDVMKIEKTKQEFVYDDILYNINFIDGAKVEFFGDTKIKFDVEFLDKNTGEMIYETSIGTNNWTATSAKYYKEYKINIKYKGDVKITHEFDLTDKSVLIQFDSKSIGDTLAWIPYVEEFRKKHNCTIYCSTFWNNFFVNQYDGINFIKPGETGEKNIYAKYNIGWYQPVDSNRNPIDYKKIPLQKTASDILGLEYKEIVPEINIPEGVRPIEEKYVCIAQYSTANTKHWHYPVINSNKGWQILVDWLNVQGYKVMVISKQKTTLDNVIDMTGDFPIEHRINQLKWCEFFIGVGSGLSWLAWATKKRVVMISGFSNPICEFQSNNINVHNFNVCNGCFNREMFDRGDWNWCPEHKGTDRHFECSKSITPEMVIDRVISSKLVEPVSSFDFSLYNSEIKINEDDVSVSYSKHDNKLSISYKNEKTTKLNIAIKDFYTGKILHVISDTSLSNEYVVWCATETPIYEDTNKILISFYEKSKILDIEFVL